MSQLAHHLLLWSQKHLRSLRTIHILGFVQPGSRWAVMSCAPRRVETPSPDGPADLETFWTRTGRPVCIPRNFSLSVVLFPDRGNTRHGRTDARTHCRTAGRGAFKSMHFPQWAFSHRHCARSGRMRSRSCSWCYTDTLWPVSESWCSSWQPLLGRFLWGRIYWLRDGAPCGTRVQTSGNFMSGPWMGRGGSRWPTPRGSRHHHFGESAIYETCLMPWSGTCSSNGALLTEKTPRSARSESWCPSCSKGLPPPSKSM